MGCGRSKGLCPSFGRHGEGEEEASASQQPPAGQEGEGLSTPPESPQAELQSPEVQEQMSVLSTQRFDEVYSLEKDSILGEGASAKVYVATHRRTRQRVAVKVFVKARMRDSEVKDMFEEVQLLQDLKHDHILQLHGFFHEPAHYYIVTDLLEGGELFDRIIEKEFYSEKEARDLIKVLLTAIQYMHSLNIVHRDLKPENILLKSVSDDTSIKIADFGFAKKDVNGEMTEKCGSPSYVAPEILAQPKYGRAVDIWSAGVIAYILLCGYPPFQGATDAELFANIQHGTFEFDSPHWDDVSELAKAFVSSMLVISPAKRATADELLQHPWITGTVSTVPLKTVVQELKRFNARRKFKAAVKTVQATASLMGRARSRGSSLAVDNRV
ncbi:CAMK/CAMK1 protein kinase [Aphanomyces invadans]|nr:CAMK/CAMK1 protein kinase [Aphanomyces invadans]ETW00902.1 CAMK/CAMK1 protein kinase [Aphanomyces invadans]|eukprot:XP_008869900.1 CAMK/CAMK1 protein kinase [Aphanomyces invadans]